MAEKKQQYNAEQIQVLEGLEPVRKRPGMYIGGTGSEGLHHLIWEIVNNSIDEALAGEANKVDVVLHEKRLREANNLYINKLMNGNSK